MIWRRIKAFLFPPTMVEQMMLGALLPIMFFLPIGFAIWLWPSDDNAFMKVLSILIGAIGFVVLKAFYMFFSLRVTELQGQIVARRTNDLNL